MPQAVNMRLLGHSDMQNRPIYEPTVHKYPSHTAETPTSPADTYANKTILFAGLHAGHWRRRLHGVVAKSV